MSKLKEIVLRIVMSFCLLNGSSTYSQNEITVSQVNPINAMNSICAGSAILIHFYSEGVFLEDNIYQCQLSDESGVFSESSTIIGTLTDNTAFDPMLGYTPAVIWGQVPQVEPGCNYAIRVISTTSESSIVPSSAFCITQCDLSIAADDIQFCVSQCNVDSDGENLAIPIEIHTYTDTLEYYPENLFSTRLYTVSNFEQVGANGVLGAVNANLSSELIIHVPCKDSLIDYGISPGEYLFEILSTASSAEFTPTSNIVRLTIGAYSSSTQTIIPYEYPSLDQTDTFCPGEIVLLSIEPYEFDANSSYLWQCDLINNGEPFFSPMGANSSSLYVQVETPGSLSFSIAETNFNCISDWIPEVDIFVVPFPEADFIVPAEICIGDTIFCQASLYESTSYSWSTSAVLNEISYFDSTLNELSIAFTNPSEYTISLSTTGECGSDTVEMALTVHPYLSDIAIENANEILYIPDIPLDTEIIWFFDDQIIPDSNNDSIVATQTGTYSVSVSNVCGTLTDDFYWVGMTESSSTNCSVYPTLVNDQYLITCTNGLTIGQLILLDIFGNIVKHEELNQVVNYTGSAIDLAPGAYILLLKLSDDSVFVKKMIKY
jgi:hypothetical protein